MVALTTALLWFSAIGCSLIAGLYFVFSTTIMRALGKLEPQAGMAVMISINETILRTAFLPLFFGTSLASLCLLALSVLDASRPNALLIGAAALVYLIGMFGCTVVFNVPLNNALAAAVAGPNAVVQWTRYLRDWTIWNHVRTVSSILAAIFVHGCIGNSIGQPMVFSPDGSGLERGAAFPAESCVERPCDMVRAAAG